MNTSGRIGWIDTTRGLSMIAILLFHTEVYYAGYDVINYGFYVGNVLMTFFFVSGYLFFRAESPVRSFSFRHKLASILRGIVMPYFIFASAMAVPKAIAHDSLTSFTDIAMGIVCGRASWFVTALAVAEALFTIAVSLSERYRMTWITPVLCLISLVAAIYTKCDALLIWNTDIALMAVAYLYFGYLYHKHEAFINRHIPPTALLPVAAVLLFLKWYEHSQGLSMLVFPLNVTSFPVFFADTVLAIVLIISIGRALPSCRFISFVGRNSIVYYFLCGGIPLITAAVMRKAGMPYNGNYLFIVVAFIIVCAATTVVTWVIMRYIPFVTGRKGRV